MTSNEQSADCIVRPKRSIGRSFWRFICSAPKYTKVTFILFLISIAIHVISIYSPSFSDFFTENIAAFFRTVLAGITGWFPFSLAETLILMIPILVVLYFALTWNHYIRKQNSMRSLVFAFFSTVMILYISAVFTFMTGYHNSPLDKKLGIEKAPVSANELYETAQTVNAHLNELQADINYGYDSFSIMPYGIDELSDKLLASYDVCVEQYSFLHNIPARIKPLALSEAMSYTHITGVYTYFTGEANIDAAFPDFTLPYTAAHEFAHQRGMARENEANFIAYLVCINSTDPYIQYSGYLNMLQYLTNALYTADSELYSKLHSEISSQTKSELGAYSRFFDKYRDSTASKVSGVVNDTYLKLQGTEGSKSYGMVVDLTVAYYKRFK